MDAENQVNRADLDQLTGSAVIEFGASWCGYCQEAQPIIAAALIQYPNVKHIKIADGKGQQLGRTYSVKLWPTLVYLKDGVEVIRIVRPRDAKIIAAALNEIDFSQIN
ncbi:MAG: thioredoxin family protein [Methylotenera sp.]|uniref:thioredoxin family protein n=1 Tax=Methylotenera sp. TaxID=2051956 RepID=UPI001823A691|nr:thioredoxin family protein [Methylotenera sp.]NOU24139.1 thioredoxin family protein [Methylotenera sp.]